MKDYRFFGLPTLYTCSTLARMFFIGKYLWSKNIFSFNKKSRVCKEIGRVVYKRASEKVYQFPRVCVCKAYMHEFNIECL